MDHIHSFPNSPFTLPDIYYEGTSYDTGAIDNYPNGLKTAVDEALRVGGESGSANLQTLLYFGMLNEVLGQVNHSQYIRSDAEGRSALTTQKLVDDVTRWFKFVKNLQNQTKKKEAILRASDCVNAVREIVEQQPIFPDERQYYDEVGTILDKDFVFAVQVLGASLAFAVSNCAEKNDIDIEPSKWTPDNPWISSKMLEIGWCPFEVDRFSKMTSPLTQLCALSLSPSANVLDHNKCSATACEANQVPSGNYNPTHAEDCPESTCHFIQSPIEEVIKILKEGALPLIEISLKSDGSPELRAVQYRSGKRYVAISHVWSDGMGNKTENAMRKCQILRIWAKARSLIRNDPKDVNSQKVVFDADDLNSIFRGFAKLSHVTRNLLDFDKKTVTIWMDTLCIPIIPYEMRILAIKSMKLSYKNGAYLISCCFVSQS